MSIKNPLWRKVYFKPKRAVILSVVIVVVFFALNFHLNFTLDAFSDEKNRTGPFICTRVPNLINLAICE